MTEQTQAPTLVDSDYIKLSKNSRGYTWDIKVLGHNIEKIKEINDKLNELYSTSLIINKSNEED